MSVFFVMLGISIESYEHVLGPPRVSLDSEKNNKLLLLLLLFFYLFLFVFKPFFNGLNGKIQNLIKE